MGGTEHRGRAPRRRRRHGGDRGAALVEFAIVLPVFAAFVLGLFSGGQLYDRKLDMSYAAREGARYGATLPPDQALTSGTWAENVRSVVLARGSLPANATVCVALVVGSPATVYGSAGTYSTGGAPCFTETGSATDARVQVQVQGTGLFETVLFSRTLTLQERSTAHLELNP